MDRNEDLNALHPERMPEPELLRRRAFLAETLAISAGASALLSGSTAWAQDKEPKSNSLADLIRIQFGEEAQVAAKYAAFAVQAKSEGHPQAARLFQALVVAETFHAEWLLRLMSGVADTAENLKVAAEVEAVLAGKVLPADAAEARREKDTKAEALFDKLTNACGQHEKVLRQVRERVLAKTDAEALPIRVCPKCGNVLIGAIPDRCPICATTSADFITVA